MKTERPSRDSLVRLSMPSTRVLGVNEAADIELIARAGDGICAQIDRNDLFWVVIWQAVSLIGIAPEFKAFEALRRHRSPRPWILAVQSYPLGPGLRTYDLKLVYATLKTPAEMILRMLPFPPSMRISMSDGKRRSGADQLPEFVLVAASPLMEETSYPAIAQTWWTELPMVAESLRSILSELERGATLHAAWLTANARYPHVGLPPQVSELCRAERPPFNEEREALRRICEEPVDALVLMHCVFPLVMSVLSAARPLRYWPQDNAADQSKFSRLQLPLRRLESQDISLGWLPRMRDYRDERDDVRDEMLGH